MAVTPLTNLCLALALAGTACAYPQGHAPESRVFGAANWHELQVVHRDLAKRLDGVVAGAFTEKVAELLAERWDLLDEFVELSAGDRTFKSDVIAALNEAVTQEHAVKILANAQNRCPSKYVGLCSQLVDALAPP